MEKDKLARATGSLRLARPDLDSPIVSTFLTAREYTVYFDSLKHAGVKRNFHATFVPVLEEVTQGLHGPSAHEQLEALVHFLDSGRKTLGGRLNGTDTQAAQRAKRTYPEACTILEVRDTLSYDELVTLKRQAILKHHPDRGGKHEDMIQVQPAYCLLHDFLCFYQDTESSFAGFRALSVRTSSRPPSALDYHITFTETLF